MITQEILDILDGSDYMQDQMDRFEGSALNTAVIEIISAMREKGWSYMPKRGGFWDYADGDKFDVLFVDPDNRSFMITVEDMK